MAAHAYGVYARKLGVYACARYTVNLLEFAQFALGTNYVSAHASRRGRGGGEEHVTRPGTYGRSLYHFNFIRASESGQLRLLGRRHSIILFRLYYVDVSIYNMGVYCWWRVGNCAGGG